jgi:DNA-binding transcriptional regulator GbsR (MarR family)
MEPAELVYKTLKESDQPLKAGEIVEKTGLDRKDVDKAMKLLKQEEKIVSPKFCFWTAK